MAKAKAKPETTDAFVLVDCQFGSVGQVVTLSNADAMLGERHGMLDLNPAAIAAAKKGE
jgi:hypothetical protein